MDSKDSSIYDPRFHADDRVEALWDGHWWPGAIVGEPRLVSSGWRYEVLLDEGGQSTFDMDDIDGPDSGHHETELRPPRRRQGWDVHCHPRTCVHLYL